MSRIVVAASLLTVVALALALIAFGPASSPAAPPPPPRPSLAGSRMFMLLPDGKVEITDAWSRRVFRWDGRQWTELAPGQSAPRASTTR